MRSLDGVIGDTELRPVIDTDDRAIVLDLSVGSDALGAPLNSLDVPAFCSAVDRRLSAAGTGFAYGRWGERRELYDNELFNAEDPEMRRDVHLGVDVFCAPGTPVHAPLPGQVFIAANNARELDYGPLLILEHDCGNGRFYTLYGHLSLDSLTDISIGQAFSAGEEIARVGAPPDNGNWAPHLHFQPVLDLLDYGADFPGVCSRREQEKWLALSPLPSAFFPQCSPGDLDGRLT